MFQTLFRPKSAQSKQATSSVNKSPSTSSPTSTSHNVASPSSSHVITNPINHSSSASSIYSEGRSVAMDSQTSDIPTFQYAPNPRSIVSQLQQSSPSPSSAHVDHPATYPQINPPQVTYYPAYHSTSSPPVSTSPTQTSQQRLISSPRQESLSSPPYRHPNTSVLSQPGAARPVASAPDPEYEEQKRIRAIRSQIEEEKALMRMQAQEETRLSASGMRQRFKPLGPGFSLDSKPPSKVEAEASKDSVKARQILTDQFIINEKFPEKRFIRHLVRPTDDLVDLAVRYRCSVSEIRQFNRRVVFEYLDNVLGEYIHIPIPDDFELPRVPRVEMSEEDQRKAESDLEVPGAGGFTLGELELQAEINRQFYSERGFIAQASKFHHVTVDENEARFYLSEASWDVRQALADFADDLRFERETEENKKKREADRKAGAIHKPSMVLAMAEARQARLTSLVTNSESNHIKQKFEDRMRRKAAALLQGDKNVPLLADSKRSD